MKSRILSTARLSFPLASALAALLAISSASAAIYYWDNNGATTGFGTAAGTWDSAGTVGSGTQGWGTDVTGVIAPTGTITTLNTNSTTDALNFGTAAAGLAAGPITVNGNVSAGNITFGSASGAVVLSTGTITLTAAQTTTVNNTTNTISSILAGAGTSFTKAGTGTLILTGANSYTGTTIIRGGTLNLGNSSTTGSLASTALEFHGGTLSYTRTDSQTKNFSTTAIKTGAASVTANAGNTLGLGDITRTAGGTLAVATTGTITTSDVNDATGILGPWAFYGNQYATVTGGTIGAYTGTTQDTESNWTDAAANYEITITGTKTLTGNRTSNTLRYGTVGGTIALGASGSNTLTTNGILAVGGAVVISRAGGTGSVVAGSTGEIVIAGTQAVTISAPISSGAVTYSGTNVLTLSGANTYSGTTTINSGRLSANTSNLSNGAIEVTGAGQLVQTSNTSQTFTNPFNISGLGFVETSGARMGAIRLSAATNGTTTLSGPITLSGDSGIGTIRPTGTFIVSGKITGSFAMGFTGVNQNDTTAPTFVLSNSANDYTGDTKIDNKDLSTAKIGSSTTLRLGASNVIPNVATGGNLVFNGADANHLTVLDLNGFNETINGLSAFAAAGARITNSATGASVLQIGDNNTTSSFSGDITDGGVGKTLAITKIGTGALTLSNANTYTGATNVNAGTLIINGSTSSTSLVTVGVNGTLGGTGTVAGAMTVAGTLSPGASPGILATGNETWLNGGDYNFQMLDATGAAGTGFDRIAVTGTLDLSSLTAVGFNINLWSLSSVGPDVNGNALNFNNALTQSWVILTTTGGITAFDAADFAINVGANNGTSGFSNALGGGSFSLSSASNNLILNFTAVPEPSTALLGGLGILALMRRRRH